MTRQNMAYLPAGISAEIDCLSNEVLAHIIEFAKYDVYKCPPCFIWRQISIYLLDRTEPLKKCSPGLLRDFPTNYNWHQISRHSRLSDTNLRLLMPYNVLFMPAVCKWQVLSVEFMRDFVDDIAAGPANIFQDAIPAELGHLVHVRQLFRDMYDDFVPIHHPELDSPTKYSEREKRRRRYDDLDNFSAGRLKTMRAVIEVARKHFAVTDYKNSYIMYEICKAYEVHGMDYMTCVITDVMKKWDHVKDEPIVE